MSTEIKLNVKSNLRSIFLFDSTSIYNGISNKHGWGSPNTLTSIIDSASVEVLFPNSKDSLFIDVHPTLPNTNNVGFELLASDLGMEEIVSGVWKFIYRVNSSTTGFSGCFSVTKYIDKSIQCCVNKKLANADFSNIDSIGNKRIIELNTLIKGARYNASVGNLEKAQLIANHISIQCKCCK